jgi:hypothetical protein
MHKYTVETKIQTGLKKSWNAPCLKISKQTGNFSFSEIVSKNKYE